MSQHCCRKKHPHIATVWSWVGHIIAAWSQLWRHREMKKTEALQPRMALMPPVPTSCCIAALGCLCPVWSPGHMRLL